MVTFKNIKNLSRFLILLLICQLTFAQQGGGILPPTLFGPPITSPIRGSVNLIEDTGSDKSLHYQSKGASLTFQTPGGGFFANANYRQTSISDSAITLEDGVIVGETLSDRNISIGFTSNSGAKSSWTFMGGFGSTSDEPFENNSDNTYRVSIVNVRKSSSKSSWIFGAFYNNNLNVGVPLLPILAYTSNPSPWLRYTVGLPFFNSIIGARDGLSLFTLLTPGGARAVFNYRIVGPFLLQVGYLWQAEGFQHINRQVREEQFFIERQSLFVGFQAPLFKGVLGRLQFGHRYNTSYFQAEGVFDEAEQDYDIEDSNFINFSLLFRI